MEMRRGPPDPPYGLSMDHAWMIHGMWRIGGVGPMPMRDQDINRKSEQSLGGAQKAKKNE